MSRKYKFGDKSELYFVTYTVIDWIDVFTRREYKDVIINSWEYCIKNKGLVIYSWCIMTNHIHMIISSKQDEVQDIMRDMKSYTSRMLKQIIEGNQQESRKEWILKMMVKAGTENKNNNDFQLWQQHNHPIILDTNFLIDQKLNYINNNPVVAGFVEKPEEYLYSSARDYAGLEGLIEITIIE